MTVYAVIKVFDNLKEADRVAELITEDDIVMVLPLETWPLDGEPGTAIPGFPSSGFPPLGVAAAPATRDALSDAAATPSGPEDLGKGLSASLTAGESNPARSNVVQLHGWSVKV